MNVFVDNCLSPVLATTLHGFILHRGHAAFHIKDLKCGRNATDSEWINFLAAEPGPWIVLTGDGRIRKNPAERAAYRNAGLRGFVLAPAFQRQPIHETASVLVWKWPAMETLINLTAGPALFELPIGRQSKAKPLPV